MTLAKCRRAIVLAGVEHEVFDENAHYSKNRSE